MGRHAAASDADVDPIVAAELARRGVVEEGPRHARSEAGPTGSPVGWPGREDDGAPAGSPVGWPGSTSGEPPREPVAEPGRGQEPERGREPERARGWRRLLGVRAA